MCYSNLGLLHGLWAEVLFLCCVLQLAQTSLVAQMVKPLPTMQETHVQSLGQEDLLEKETATHSSILAWKERPGGLQSMGLQKSQTRLSDQTAATTP